MLNRTIVYLIPIYLLCNSIQFVLSMPMFFSSYDGSGTMPNYAQAMQSLMKNIETTFKTGYQKVAGAPSYIGTF